MFDSYEKKYQRQKMKFGNRRQITAFFVGFRWRLPNSGSDCWILATLTEFRQSDTKIQGSSTVESGYQQSPMFGGGEFLQTCVQE